MSDSRQMKKRSRICNVKWRKQSPNWPIRLSGLTGLSGLRFFPSGGYLKCGILPSHHRFQYWKWSNLDELGIPAFWDIFIYFHMISVGIVQQNLWCDETATAMWSCHVSIRIPTVHALNPHISCQNPHFPMFFMVRLQVSSLFHGWIPIQPPFFLYLPTQFANLPTDLHGVAESQCSNAQELQWRAKVLEAQGAGPVVRSSVRRASQARGDGPWGTMGHHGPWGKGGEILRRYGGNRQVIWDWYPLVICYSLLLKMASGNSWFMLIYPFKTAIFQFVFCKRLPDRLWDFFGNDWFRSSRIEGIGIGTLAFHRFSWPKWWVEVTIWRGQKWRPWQRNEQFM